MITQVKEQIIDQTCDDVWGAIFLLIGSIPNIDGDESGRIASRVAQIIEYELTILLSSSENNNNKILL